MRRQKLRSFGLTVGGIFGLIGVWPVVIRGDIPRWWAVILAGLLVIPALVLPGSFSWIYKRWMALGHILGWINTRIILGFVFYFIVTPIGTIRRLLGKDSIGRKIDPNKAISRISRQSRPASHLRKQV